MASPRDLPPSRTPQSGHQLSSMRTPSALRARASSPQPPIQHVPMQHPYSSMRALTPTPTLYSQWYPQHHAQSTTFNYPPTQFANDQMDLDFAPAPSIPPSAPRSTFPPAFPPSSNYLPNQHASSASSSTSSDASSKRGRHLMEAEDELSNSKNEVLYWCRLIRTECSPQSKGLQPSSEGYEDLSRANEVALRWIGYLEVPRRSIAVEAEHFREMKEELITSTSSGIFKDANNSILRYLSTYELVEALKAPTPSQFGDMKCWEERQAKDPILCLRPPTAIGLPVTLLHDGFREYESNVSNPDFKVSFAARKAAGKLCMCMGQSFKTEADRSRDIDSALQPLWPGLVREFPLKPHKDYASGRSDRACIGFLCEHKLECCSGKSDGYMQLCRCFQLYVEAVMKKEIACANRDAYIDAGCPTFLLLIQGPLIHIYGAFFDGQAYVVEPLGDPLTMLRDARGVREQKLSKILTALKLGHDGINTLISNAQPQPYKFPPRTPRIYRTCTLYTAHSEQGSEAELQFLHPLVDTATVPIHHLIFRAIMHYNNGDKTDVVVKIPQTYSPVVHIHLFRKGLAPKLLAYCTHRDSSIPTAYVIELLPPSWITLHSFANNQPNLFALYHTKIREVLDKIITHLKESKFVHGDLRANNLMIDTALQDGEVNIKLVDFDWSGVAESALYPGSRSDGPGFPGEAGGPIGQDDDFKLLEHWWGKLVGQHLVRLNKGT